MFAVRSIYEPVRNTFGKSKMSSCCSVLNCVVQSIMKVVVVVLQLKKKVLFQKIIIKKNQKFK